MSSLEHHIKPYSKAIVKLLKQPIENSQNLWIDVINYQVEIQEYLNQIGLELVVKKDEGFAYLKELEDREGNTLGLVSKRKIGFEASIILVVLRQSLEDFDQNPTQFEVSEKFISSQEIKEEVELFLPETYNKVKLLKDLDLNIRRIVELGYLKEIDKNDFETKYQIHRIIKEKVTLDQLQEFKNKLESYVESI
ncbi:DUF4194 domain-containing protein [Faecalibacter rhinopitheci]|uniref:DUF4194 domain-containing protein n=1 Tax=Faecalibacter rhinopitheci TaxID=2779678 RepID=A0A8J7FSZ7_9FLAO|nr:DUF4194 domain-containing protein [Faecalibacter rhinopitheci]MBF0597147.1 DUF4194 domain-containing protein [Faecalibacter rhinopitheci]MBQ0148490.1 DUF4194 domain-containing protein [Candidatus Onthonaster equi]